MTMRRVVSTFAIASALVAGCSPGPNSRFGTTARSSVRPTQGADTGALASDTTSPSAAWPASRQNEAARPREDAIHVHADGEITRRVGTAIVSSDNLSGTRNVVVTTHQGVVTIRGNVASARDRQLIHEAVRAVPGVTRVDNQLSVGE